MIHTAICDDEKEFVNDLRKLLTQYCIENGEEFKLTIYFDGIELFEKYDPTIDLIFLDIQIKIVDGLSAAEQIRQRDKKVGIIFLTTLTQYSLEGYKYQAANYIIKPLKYMRLKSELDRVLKLSCQEDNPGFIIVNDTGKYKVELKAVRYVETFNCNLLFYMEQENIFVITL